MSNGGPTKIMVIRHAEKPGPYNGKTFNGVNHHATACGSDGAEDLTTIGWQRAGGLVTLFAPPYGPKPSLAKPDFLYAADPNESKKAGASPEAGPGHDGPSQRPYETLLPLAAALGKPGSPMAINQSFAKKHYPKMIQDALGRSGTVLISWQHQDIALLNGDGQPGISQCILDQTGTKATFPIPQNWPKDSGGVARYDLVFVFDRNADTGLITNFTLVPQFLLSGDGP